MKIPDRIKIAGHWIDIRVTDTCILDNNFVAGVSIGGAGIIELSRLTTDKRFRTESDLATTFLHEILHHITYRYLETSLADTAIDQLAEGLFQVLRDNHLHFDNEETPE
jgi:hypothetical protein